MKSANNIIAISIAFTLSIQVIGAVADYFVFVEKAAEAKPVFSVFAREIFMLALVLAGFILFGFIVLGRGRRHAQTLSREHEAGYRRLFKHSAAAFREKVWFRIKTSPEALPEIADFNTWSAPPGNSRYKQTEAQLHTLAARSKYAKQMLPETEKHIKTVLETIPYGLVEYDRSGRITYANIAYHKMFDYTEAETLGMAIWHTLSSPMERDEQRDYLAGLLDKQPLPTPHITKRQTKSGKLMEVEVTWDYNRDSQGQLIGFIAVFTDISKRKRVAERMRTVNQTLRILSECSQAILHAKEETELLRAICSIIVRTRRYRFAWIAFFDTDSEKTASPGNEGKSANVMNNCGSRKFFDINAGSSKNATNKVTVATSKPDGWFPEMDPCEGATLISLPLVAQGRTLGELNLCSGETDVFDTEEMKLLTSLAANLAHGIVALRTDEERKCAEEALKISQKALKRYSEQLEEMVRQRTQSLRDAQEKLVRQEKLAFLGQLAGGVGHELRNPLGVISNAIYYLKMKHFDANETTREYLEIISTEVRNSEKIVADLLNFARIQTPEKKEVDLSELIGQVLQKQEPPDRVSLHTEGLSGLPPVFVDPRQIKQVLINVLNNAYQAMPEGGEVTISTQAEQSSVAISITDTGPGIPEDTIRKIFEPLFTTKARGIGLGLAISRNLLEGNRGSIAVNNPPGEGAAFTINLPARAWHALREKP
ncbi:MAG: PAS domain S-box protein [Gammaproteobacteria bacterium]|nr:PAS domain S-box protein [Gammaproteobacteria bacterium]